MGHSKRGAAHMPWPSPSYGMDDHFKSDILPFSGSSLIQKRIVFPSIPREPEAGWVRHTLGVNIYPSSDVEEGGWAKQPKFQRHIKEQSIVNELFDSRPGTKSAGLQCRFQH